VYYHYDCSALVCWTNVQGEVESCLNVVSEARRKKPDVEVIDMALTAKLGSLAAAVCTQHHMITDMKIDGLFTSTLSFVRSFVIAGRGPAYSGAQHGDLMLVQYANAAEEGN